MGRYGCDSQCVARIRPDHLCRIHLSALFACHVRVTVNNFGLCYCSSVMAFKCQLTPLSINSLPKKAQIILCKTSLDPVRMAWSDFGQVHLVWKQASVQESLGLVLVKCSWPITSKFPTFRFSCALPQAAQIVSYKTRPDPVWFWLTVSGFGQTDLIQNGRSKPMCKNHWPTLANAYLLRSGMFTGLGTHKKLLI